MKTIGQRILEYRVVEGISQAKMAKRMHEYQTTISRAEQELPMHRATAKRLEMKLEKLEEM